MTALRVFHRRDGAADLPVDAPTLIFSGSLGSDLAMWDPQVAELATLCHIIRYDTRGHGQSPVPTEPSGCTIDDLADDLLALMDRLEVQQAHLVGLSLGGMTVLRFAARYPERVKRVAVLCTSALLGPAQGWRDRAATVRAEGAGAVADAVVSRWFTQEFAAQNPSVIARHRDMVGGTSAAGYAGCCEAIAAMDLRSDLARIQAPTLVIAGRQDPATPPSHLEVIADGIADSRFEILDPGAHLASAEQPARVNSLLAQHFQLLSEAPPHPTG